MISDFGRFTPHFFLSNFFPHQIAWNGMTGRTLEHVFQAAKAKTEQDRHWVLSAALPGDAKRRGREIAIKPTWMSERVSIMRQLIAIKFTAGTALAKKLVKTGDEELVEGNTWGDCFWGICRGTGENMLGKLLMEQREVIRAKPVA